MKRTEEFRQLDPVTGIDEIQRISCADVLRQRQRPVALFTAALLFTHGKFDRDPVLEFDARYPAANPDMRPFCVELKRDHEFFFKGLGICPAPGTTQPVNWDKRLYAIDQSRTMDCFAFIGGIAFSNPETGFFGNAFSYDLLVPDPTSTKNDTLVVRSFGVMTSQFSAFLEYRQGKQPRVRTMPTPEFERRFNPQTVYDGTDPLLIRED